MQDILINLLCRQWNKWNTDAQPAPHWRGMVRIFTDFRFCEADYPRLMEGQAGIITSFEYFAG